MNNRTALTYIAFLLTLFLLQLVLPTFFGATVLAAILATLPVVGILQKPSVFVLSSLTAVATILFPTIVLFAIGQPYGISPVESRYLLALDNFIMLVLPTLAVAITTLAGRYVRK
jgi:hypothetical protein